MSGMGNRFGTLSRYVGSRGSATWRTPHVPWPRRGARSAISRENALCSRAVRTARRARSFLLTGAGRAVRGRSPGAGRRSTTDGRGVRMTDTGQVPGEGLPEDAGMVEQPGVTTLGAYTFLDRSESPVVEVARLVMRGPPGPQGACGIGRPPATPRPLPDQPGRHG